MTESSSHDGIIVITGATGWVGRTAMHELQKILSPSEFLKRVRPFASRESKLPSTGYDLNRQILIPIYSLANLPELAYSNSISTLFHAAFLTRDRLPVIGFENYVKTNRWITQQVKATLQLSPKARAVLISSGAAEVFDNNQSFLSHLAQDPYGVLKKEEEVSLFNLVSSSIVLRIYALSGRFIRNPKRFALGDFLLMALRGDPILINSQNPVLRSYGNAGDIASFGWHWLFDIRPSFFTSPIAAVSIQTDLLTLAKQISILFDNLAVISNQEVGAPPNSYVADQTPFLRGMSHYEIRPKSLEDQLKDTLDGLRDFPQKH